MFHLSRNPNLAILAHYKVYVYKRPGYQMESVLTEHPSVKVVTFPQMDISASYIRKCVQEGISIEYLVPKKVRACIEEMGLFKTKP